MSTVKPRFQIEKLKGTTIRRVVSSRVDPEKKDRNGNPKLLGGFDYEDKKVDAGWMVYFPSGSSIHVLTEEEMERQGFLRDPTLVDMETGYDTEPAPSASFKSKSEQLSARSKSSRPAHTT